MNRRDREELDRYIEGDGELFFEDELPEPEADFNPGFRVFDSMDFENAWQGIKGEDLALSRVAKKRNQDTRDEVVRLMAVHDSEDLMSITG